MDKKSTFGRVTFAMFLSEVTAKIKAIIKNGIKSQKIHRHEASPKMAPAIVGPTAGANMMTKPTIPIAAPNL